VVIKTPSPLPRSTTFGVAGHNRHTGLSGGSPHRRDNGLQIGQREAFFQDEGGRQIKRRCPHHGHVVDRTVHRQGADIAAGKDERRNNMRIASHHHPSGWHRQQGAIVSCEQFR
jgi:hypothetical protein